MDWRAIFIAFFISILMALSTRSASIPNSSNVVSRLRRSETKMCSELLPCQWGVYGDDARRKIRFHIDNKSCTCGDDRKCVIAEENLSMAAFIYRCVPDNPTTTSTTTTTMTTPENSDII